MGGRETGRERERDGDRDRERVIEREAGGSQSQREAGRRTDRLAGRETAMETERERKSESVSQRVSVKQTKQDRDAELCPGHFPPLPMASPWPQDGAASLDWQSNEQSFQAVRSVSYDTVLVLKLPFPLQDFWAKDRINGQDKHKPY